MVGLAIAIAVVASGKAGALPSGILLATMFLI